MSLNIGVGLRDRPCKKCIKGRKLYEEDQSFRGPQHRTNTHQVNHQHEVHRCHPVRGSRPCAWCKRLAHPRHPRGALRLRRCPRRAEMHSSGMHPVLSNAVEGHSPKVRIHIGWDLHFSLTDFHMSIGRSVMTRNTPPSCQ